MKKVSTVLLFLIMSFLLMSLIVRHDVSDERFIELGKKYPQICHLSDGEATLIKENWTVTAAHAAIILKEELENGKIPKVSIAHKQYEIEKVILHPNFKISNTAIENDIALIQIKGSITSIPFAKLYDKQNEKGKQITIVGRGDFGTGLTGPQHWDKITRAATNRIDEVEGQWIIFSFDNPQSENTTELEGISGPGDSGGPAFIDLNNVRYIVGVSSNQQNNSEKKGVYGVTEYYARISFYKKWIEESIK